MRVSKECKKIVTPYVSSPKGKLKISFFDQIQPPIYVGIIFYYKNQRDNHHGAEVDIHKKLVKLEKSLSETLVLFYPFAGRYIEEEGGSFIDCGDQGVEYVIANIDGYIDLLLDTDIDSDMLEKLSSFPTKWENGIPLTVIQVNVFKCGGLAIGVQFCHKLADMFTLSMFMSAWSMACCGGINQVIPPNFDLGSLFPQKGVERSPIGGVMHRPPIKILSNKFVVKKITFYNDVISKLKGDITNSKFSVSNGKTHSSQISRVEVVSAVISKAIIETKWAKHDVALKPFIIAQAMNLRGKTNLHIEENSCGNFYTPILTPPINIEQSVIAIHSVLDMIGDAIRKAKLQFSIATNVNLCSLVEEATGKYLEILNESVNGEINLIPFSSWCKFSLNEMNFGWGMPDLVSSTMLPFESIVLIDSKLNNGIEAWVILKHDDMLMLKHKLDTILRF